MAALDDKVHAILNIHTKCEILRQLRDININPSSFYSGDLNYDVYFSFYTDQCQKALYDGGRHASVRSHRDILEIARHVKNNVDRISIRDMISLKLSVPKPQNEDELSYGSIDLVARLLTMVAVGRLQYSFTGRGHVAWTASALKNSIYSHFNAPIALHGETVKLEKVFNARNLKRIGGIEIEWTKNLADHLSFDDFDQKVSIFYHASFLECHRQSPLYPPGLIDETIQTLKLLFPGTDTGTRKWFRKLSSRNNLDKKLLRCGRLRAEDRRIENFHFWHDRLIILKQIFDEAEPSTIQQWWCDRRKRVQWYTFWVAALVLALTILFGVIQCVEGALQVYKAFNP
ncbi:uncharacterized protein LY89DRAFT_696318 [Mollisia scopiformis]|uniref:Uncharacterized protein n=1 Tax=Mollisia scopiformis TaxID=149040 RepID=A0A194XGN1_MOLSC|nr:uncharacterized protein LY89DRAFT_696318 [Mollisia scopiformis]KUJ18927.1 hypothetical protein LY89DRAFT_696318 [Mollisia scopiformis]